MYVVVDRSTGPAKGLKELSAGTVVAALMRTPTKHQRKRAAQLQQPTKARKAKPVQSK
jgi:hypothetical protein